MNEIFVGETLGFSMNSMYSYGSSKLSSRLAPLLYHLLWTLRRLSPFLSCAVQHPSCILSRLLLPLSRPSQLMCNQYTQRHLP